MMMRRSLTQRRPNLETGPQDMANQSQSLGEDGVRSQTRDHHMSKSLTSLIFKYFEIAGVSTTDVLIIYEIIVTVVQTVICHCFILIYVKFEDTHKTSDVTSNVNTIISYQFSSLCFHCWYCCRLHIWDWALQTEPSYKMKEANLQAM